MTWFEHLTGCPEDSATAVREQLYVDGPRLHSRSIGHSWRYGKLETPTLVELRERAGGLAGEPRATSVREVIADVQRLHVDEDNAHALFQVASQFNLLEMVSPEKTPDCGVGIYEWDPTQGPACAIAAGAGTIYRNYFATVNGRIGQTADNQIDCLAGLGALLGNTNQRLWRMVNGYALPSAAGLEEINAKLKATDEPGLDQLRQALQIGLQWGTQVTLKGASHVVSQAYCSALPVAYSGHAQTLWTPFATLVLEAAYEATFCAAILNAERTQNNTVFLTLLGGGAFGNDLAWILQALRRCLHLYSNCGLDVAIVSYGRSKPCVQQLVAEFTAGCIAELASDTDAQLGKP
ncbi:hypothetical protein KBY97_06295 [Synechococcus sp. ATX 2A4]|nr:hypothetical protein [Synechococcus sp. ATX 2A4]